VLKKISLILLASLVLIISACSAATSSPTDATAPNAAGQTSQATTTTASNPVRVSIRIGSLPRIYDIIAFVAKQEGLFDKNHVSVEILSFRSEVEKDNAMLAGDLDGVIEGTYGAINLNKNEETSKLVGHNLMAHMFDLVVSASSGITQPSQLKGKDIATSTGTIMEYALDQILASGGVNSQDVNFINVPNMPLRLEMLNQGKIAAALFTSPLSDQAVASGNILLLDDTKELLGGPGLIFSSAALKNKSEGISGFIQAWQEAVQMINANPEKYRNIIIQTVKVPDSLAATYKIPVFPLLRLPTQAEYARINDWMLKKGMIAQNVPYEKAIESKFLK
jgi:NitT/TauT family transport system substrate-binding protein